MSNDDHEHEVTGSRAEIAAALSGVADGVLAGRIRLGEGDEAVAVDTPEELTLEVELETIDGEVELELELAWPTPEGDGPVVLSIEEDGTEGAEPLEAGDGDEETAAGSAPPTPVGAADGSDSLARFEVFQDRGDEWRWRLRHRNGNVIAASGEGYTRKHNAWKGPRSVVRNAPAAEVTEDG
jgi:amphi-Trp domain-containing protein